MSSFKLCKLKALVDEVLRIQLNCIQHNKVTLYSFVDQKNIRYSSISHFNTNISTQTIDLHRDPSVSGCYKGIEPMGPFWSMGPEQSVNHKPGARILVRDARDTIKTTLQAYAGHLQLEELPTAEMLCEISLIRSYLSDSVERIHVKHGRIRGTLFVPRDYHSCPAVIDLFGMGGGIMEFRAALLASKGFITLSLPYFGYDDLPKSYEVQDISYFEEATDFLLAYPNVIGDGVGVVGVSKGGEIAALMASFFGSKVKATVVLNALTYATSHDVQYRDVFLEAQGFHLVGDAEYTPKGLKIGSLKSRSKEEIFPVERASSAFLLVHGDEDMACPWDTPDLLAERLINAGKSHQFRIIRYPGAGHLLEPPFSPLCDSAYVKASGMLIYYGGRPREHNIAQVEFWKELQSFFRNKLGESIS